jgi:ribosome-associated protein
VPFVHPGGVTENGDLDGGLLVRRGVVVPARELRWRFSRSSGPGGQGVNTTDSRVELSFDVANSPSLPDDLRDRALRNLRLVDGVITIAAGDSRSQLRNREAARERLLQALREATKAPPPTRRPTKPTKGSQRRRLDAKTRRGAVKKLRGRPDE